MPRECAFVLSRDRIPQPNLAYQIPSCERTAIRRIRNANDSFRMPIKALLVQSRLDVPQPSLIPESIRGQRVTIR